MPYDNLLQATITFEQKAQQISGNQAWIFNAKRDPNSKPLTRLDEIVRGMPDIEKGKLKKRFGDVIPNNAQQFKREYDDQFIEALVEVLGWGWLQDKYPSCKVHFSEPPDLIAQDNEDRLIAAMACKKIRTSDEDRNYFKHHQGEIRNIDTRLTSTDTGENPLLRKTSDTLCKAEEQLSKVKAPEQFIFVNFSWDVSIWAVNQKPAVIRLISNLKLEWQKRGIELIAFENLQPDKAFDFD